MRRYSPSADAWSDALLFEGGGFSGRAVTVHRNAVNFIGSDGSLLTLVSPSVFPGRGRVSFPLEGMTGEFFEEGDALSISEGLLSFDGRGVRFPASMFRMWREDALSDLPGADVVSRGAFDFAVSVFPLLRPGERRLMRTLVSSVCLFAGIAAPSFDAPDEGDPVYDRISSLWLSFLESDLGEAPSRAFVKGAVGLGYGFTPSGDDVLSGILCAGSMMGAAYGLNPLGPLSRAAVAGSGATSVVSGKLLRTAASGARPLELSRLFRIMAGRPSSDSFEATHPHSGAVGYMLGHGCSSGREIMAGFAAGVLLCRFH